MEMPLVPVDAMEPHLAEMVLDSILEQVENTFEEEKMVVEPKRKGKGKVTAQAKSKPKRKAVAKVTRKGKGQANIGSDANSYNDCKTDGDDLDPRNPGDPGYDEEIDVKDDKNLVTHFNWRKPLV